MAGRAQNLRWNVSSWGEADLGTVAVLARMQLVARRAGWEIRLQGCPQGLRELLNLAGLSETLPVESYLAVEAGRQAEEREHPRGVQEEGDPGDLPA